MKTQIAIIGAGPPGLTLAHALLRRGVGDFIVLESAEDAGGLCRTRSNFVPGARGHWRETRRGRNVPFRPGAFRHSSEYSYPLNTIGKNEAMAALLAETAASRVFGLGRWGEWQHYNTDVVVERALALAERIAS